jgi:hypothetical protein
MRQKPQLVSLALVILSVCTSFSFIIYFHCKSKGGIYDAILAELNHTQQAFSEPIIYTNTTTASHDRKRGMQNVENITGRTRSTLRTLCFPNNTDEWLEAGSRRLGNSDDTSMMGNELIFQSILDIESLLIDRSHSRALLQQTLCHEKSRVLTMAASEEEYANPSTDTIHAWTFRLIYWATHIHQHIHAVPEAKVRVQQSQVCQSQMEPRRIGNFDFECPDAKFLVVSLGKLGLGADMRLGAVNALIAGIASNRTVVFLNNAPMGPKTLREPWPLASCSRLDMQCFYMPISPCTLTHEDIEHATVLGRGDARRLFRLGELGIDLDEEQVLVMDQFLRPQRTPPTLRENLVAIIHQHIIRPLQEKRPDDPLLGLLLKAANHTLADVPIENNKYPYYGKASNVNHALVFYTMRPNPFYSQKLDGILHQTIAEDFDPNLALGLPIRASDKCNTESECLRFDQYMTLMERTWKQQESIFLGSQHGAATKQKASEHGVKPSVIVTSESPEVDREQAKYLQGGLEKNVSFPFQFVNNRFDLHQGTGDPEMMKLGGTNGTLDDIMLSAISSLKLQLHARHTVGNCCSNFHLLLFDFLEEGCGPAKDQNVECLQDNEAPEYRLCCLWSKTDECLNKKNATK